MDQLLSPRKQPKQARAKATYDAVLQATAQLLVEEGADGITTNRVAKKAGVSIGSLYQYFPNKEALFVALLQGHIEKMLGILTGAVDELFELPIEEAVRSYIQGMMQAHADEAELHAALSVLIPRLASRADIADLHERAQVPVRLWLEKHKANIRVQNLDLAAFLLVTSVEMVTHSALVERPAAVADGSLTEELTQMVLGYLGVR